MTFHNLSRYESQLFIKKLKGKCEDKKEEIKFIPENEGNYITFSRQVVVDSFVKDGKMSWLKETCGSSIHSDLWLPV